MVASFAKYSFAASLLLVGAVCHADGGLGLRGLHLDLPAATSANSLDGGGHRTWYGNAGRLRIYGSHGQGFMLPASGAWPGLAGSDDGGDPAASLKTDGAEFGLTAPLGRNVSASLSLYRAGSGQYAPGMMRHDGLALALDGAWANGVSARLAYTSGQALQARTACLGLCVGADSVLGYTGGVPEQTMYGELSWRHPRLGFRAGLEARYVNRGEAAEFSSTSTTAYFNANAHVGIEQRLGGWRIQEFARIDNLASRGYGGSEAPGRYFDFGGERNYQIGIRAGYSW